MGVYENINGSQIPIASNLRTRNVPIESFVTEEELVQGLATKNDIFQYETMPTASEELVGKVVQYIGETTSSYIKGYFYECVSDEQIPATYSWVQKNVVDLGDYLKANTIVLEEPHGIGEYNKPYQSSYITVVPQADGSVNCTHHSGGQYAGAIFTVPIDSTKDNIIRIDVKNMALEPANKVDMALFCYKNSSIRLNYGSIVLQANQANTFALVTITKNELETLGITSESIDLMVTTNLVCAYNIAYKNVTGEDLSVLSMADDVLEQKYSLKGKKFLFLGDSITSILNSSGNQNWTNWFTAMTRITRIANVAVAGAVLADYEDTVLDGDPKESVQHNNTLSNQVQKIINNQYEAPDVIMIAIGINGGIYADDTKILNSYIDNGQLRALGDIDRTTHEGAFRYCNETLHNLYPNAKIVWCNPIECRFVPNSVITCLTITNYGEALKKLTACGSSYNIETNRCGIRMAYEIPSVNGEYLRDGLHPNWRGAKLIAEFNAAAISKLVV